MALHELDLTDAQESAIEGALETLRAGMKGERPEGRAPFAVLAAGVRAGKVDVAAVVAKAGTPGAGFEAHRAAVANALQTLHATLTKEQRRALVDTLAARAEAHGPHGKGAGKQGERAGGPPPGGPLGHLLGRLDLDEDQQEAIARVLEADTPAPPSAADHEAMKQHVEAMRVEMRARLESFAADTFDARTFLAPPAGDKAPGGAGVHGPAAHLERMAKTLAAVVPLLEPEQREALAKDLEQGPPRRH
ncbi:Hypothetical protein CAP_8460 [Chondromyces apiculatus DSM 436]|uniref:Uncharacterized protein n=1 Tax=Chondromyces apiculatus DSM 436 TaxID=1192034 RepID=A0A017SYC3_9BACT|nr:Hypothetical protein CAP_8460 [Chondromyces apiculatus DSM 436]